MPSPLVNVVVVGSGVIGLSCARALARTGRHRVIVVDGGARGREASLAAAGILGPGSEHDVDSPIFRLSLDALRAWPATLSSWARETGREIPADWTGSLLVARDASEAAALARRGEVHRAAGLASRLLGPDEARTLEPGLSHGIVAALHVPEGRIEPVSLHSTLTAACVGSGVELRVGTEAGELVGDGPRVRGVRVGEAVLAADAVVVAAGAWSETLARTCGVALPSAPVKGRLVRLDAPDGRVRHVVKRAAAYVVPQAGKGLVLGTTAESVGFDRSVSDELVRSIRRAAEDLLDGLESLRAIESWYGFRPRLADGLPAIGPVGAREGLFLATGHFRNGILLCDITGRLIERAVEGDLDPRLAPFSPDRFAVRPGRPPTSADRVAGTSPAA